MFPDATLALFLDDVSRSPVIPTHALAHPHHPPLARTPSMASAITAPLALGAKASVRGAKVASKRSVAVKAVDTTARAQISKGTSRRERRNERRFFSRRRSIASRDRAPTLTLPAPPRPRIARLLAADKAAAAAAVTLAAAPAANASELGEVRVPPVPRRANAPPRREGNERARDVPSSLQPRPLP